MSNSRNYCNILSLSGGGCRGIFQAAYLNKLQDQIGKPLREVFDLIAGTSTGAIIALAIALGISPSEIEGMYRDNASSIFTKRKGHLFRRGPTYNQNILRESLKKIYKRCQLGDVQDTIVLITASKVHNYSHHVFSSYEPDDHHLDAVDVALASAAAPTYFPPVIPKNSAIEYVDGGLWANSPSLEAILYAKHTLQYDLQKIKLLAVDTGDSPVNNVALESSYKYTFKTIITIYELLHQTQKSSANYHTEQLIGKERYMRVTFQRERMIPLDDADECVKQLPQFAEDQAKNNAEVLRFLGY